MSEALKINASSLICDNQYLVRSVCEDDIDILRSWKNDHKEYFFHKTEITKAQQIQWYKSFSRRVDDHIFVVLDAANYVGCVGARCLDENVDLYNIILGDKNYKGKHVMTKALWAVASICTLLYEEMPINVRVLKSNPAINWYKKIGFAISSEAEGFVNMELDCGKIKSKYVFRIENPS